MDNHQWSTYLFSVLFLFLFGVLYDWFVSWLHRTGRERGVTAFLVVIGVLVTVLVGGFSLGFEAVGLLAGLFAASGLPMIFGSWKRYTDERGRDEREAHELAAHALAGRFLRVGEDVRE